MKKSEVAKLLVYVQSAERRSAPDELWVEVWHETLGDLDYSVAMSAVRAHYASSSRSIMPADILGLSETLSSAVPALPSAAEVDADLLGMTMSEYIERVQSDPAYLDELRAARPR